MRKLFFLPVFAFFCSCGLFAQQANQSGNKVTIKINANVNGKEVIIDTTVASVEDFDIDEFLEDLGLDNTDMMDISISDLDFNFDFDTAGWMALPDELGFYEMPELPELPALPEMPEGLMSFNMNSAFLGVVTNTVKEGAQISEVTKESGAEAAGLQKDDIITKIDEYTVESTSNLTEIIGKYEPGDKIKVTFLREGKSKTATATLQENKNSFSNYDFSWDSDDNMKMEERGFLGVDLSDANEKGVTISHVEEGSAAEAAGLKDGDVITEIDGKKMESYDDVVDAISSKKPGEEVTVKVLREGAEKTVKATLKSRKMYYYHFEDKEEGYAPAPHGVPGSPDVIMGNAAPQCVHAFSIKTPCAEYGKSVAVKIRIIKENESSETAREETKEMPSTGKLISPADLKFYPNPTDGSFHLLFNLENTGDTEITVSDMSGKEVYREELKNFQGSYEKSIDLGNNPKGNYLIRVSQNGNSVSKTIVLQ